jgi:putative ABC transport system permease protein
MAARFFRRSSKRPESNSAAHARTFRAAHVAVLRSESTIYAGRFGHQLATVPLELPGASMDIFIQDLRYAVRMLVKSPSFSIAAIVILALGIGANTAVFSLVDVVLLRPLPFANAHQLMELRLTDPKEDINGEFGDADFLATRDQQKSFSQIAAYALGQNGVSFSNGGEAQRVKGSYVTSGFFDVLGIVPERGRGFIAADGSPTAERVAVISHDFWSRQLGADASIVGKSITLNGRAVTVVGIAPANVRFPSNEPVDVWQMMRVQPGPGRPPYYLEVFGRLKPGVSPQQAAEELSAISKSVEKQYPNSSPTIGRVESLQSRLTGRVRDVLYVLLGAVAFVLLIAVANVGSLLLARATARRKEIAVRLALGASRQRILRQLLTESVLLAVIGAGFGVLLAIWAQSNFREFQSTLKIPFAYEVGVDWRVLLFTAAVSIVAGVLFGIAPGLHRSGGSQYEVLKDAERGNAGGTGPSARRALVVAEFAIALVLVVGASLLIRSFVRLQDVNPGFSPDHLVTAQVALPSAQYRDDKAIVALWDELLRRANHLPGVKAASLTMALPPNVLRLTNPFTAEGQPYDRSRPQQLAEESSVSPGHFTVLGVPIIMGRDFTEADATSPLHPIIINRTLAERYFPGQNPIGRRLQTGDLRPEPPDETIIGVVGDVKYSGLDSESVPQAYKLYSGKGWTELSWAMYVVLRTDGDPASAISGLRNELATLDRNLPLADVSTMRERMGQSVGQQRFRTLLLGSFAGFALLLACFGVYALISYSVAQRHREIGIRMAMGAARGDILRLVLRQCLFLCALGIVVGLVAATALARTLRSLLFGVTPGDPVSFALTVALLGGVAMVAGYIPARRATRVDPLEALRYE